jgi:hypothetical protein
MKNMTAKILAAFFLASASVALAVSPSIDVTVSDASGKVGFKGKTDSNGTFATGKLAPGNYVVQFNSTSLKGDQAPVVSAGSKKMTASSVTSGQFRGGGIAMRIEVGKGLNITGQVAPMATGMVGSNQRSRDASVEAVRGIQDHAGIGDIKPMGPAGQSRP